MYCSHCGALTVSTDEYCPSCGYPTNGKAPILNKEDDKKSFWLGFLSFNIPIVGIILYCLWKDEYPLKASSCKKGLIAIAIFMVVCFILTIILTILAIIIGTNTTNDTVTLTESITQTALAI